MPNDTITFQCPSCGIKLTVPGNLAGVTGPCPNCRNAIQAPFPSPSPAPLSQGYPQGPASAPAPVYQPPAAVPQPQPSAPEPQTPTYQPQAPAYQQQASAPAPAQAYPPPVYQPPAPVSQPQAPAYQPQAPAPAPAEVYPPPVYQPSAPVSQPQAPAYQPQASAPVYPPPTQTYQPPAPAYQPQATPPAGYPSEPIVYPAAPPVYQPQPQPQPQPAYVPAGYEAPQQPAYAPVGYEPLPQPTAAPAPVAYEPPPLPSQPFEQQTPVLLVPESAPSSSPAVLRPEPRQLPQRSSSEPVAKQMPEPTPGGTSSKRGNPLPRHPHRKGPFTRFMLLFLFVIAAGALVFGVLTVLNNQTKDPAPAKPLLPPLAAPAMPGNTSPVKPSETPAPKSPVIPASQPEQPQIVEPPPELPEGIEPVTPSSQAREVLDKFLAAKTLAERLPLIETKTAQAELEASCLARPLPAADKIYIETLENNPMEQVSDFYHSIDFIGENNQLIPHILLVRIRGAGEPKVVVDPFLDTYGGRLAAYAKTPVDQAGVFQITVSALASCYNVEVPNREKKLTLKLLPRDNEKAIAEAYFGRQSKIGMMLEDGTYSLSYGKAKACTVMLRWNKEDKPEKPYLEAIQLTSLDWNP